MSHEAAVREKTEHLSPNMPSDAGYPTSGYANDPLARDHYKSSNYNDMDSNLLQRTTTGLTLTPEMFERMYLNPKTNV